MARRGLFPGVQSPDDQRLQRIQEQLKVAFDAVASDHDILSSPVQSMVETGQIPAGKSIVVFRGNTGQTLSLPAANSQGLNVSAILVLLNTSANAVTVIPTSGNTLNGALTLSLAAGSVLTLVSDSMSKWLTQVSGGGGVTDGDKGDVVVSVGGTVWTLDTAVTPRKVSATLDFGAGSDLAIAVVTGQPWVTAASRVTATLGAATADHDIEDGMIEEITLAVGDLVVGTGFSVYGHAPDGTHGQYNVNCVGLA